MNFLYSSVGFPFFLYLGMFIECDTLDFLSFYTWVCLLNVMRWISSTTFFTTCALLDFTSAFDLPYLSGWWMGRGYLLLEH